MRRHETASKCMQFHDPHYLVSQTQGGSDGDVVCNIKYCNSIPFYIKYVSQGPYLSSKPPVLQAATDNGLLFIDSWVWISVDVIIC